MYPQVKQVVFSLEFFFILDCEAIGTAASGDSEEYYGEVDGM
jgi:hypothetical protein